MAEADITHIGQLTSDPKNARKHNPRNIGMIADALNEVGAARSIVIDEHGRILAGNGTIDAAAQAGIERVRVVETDGNEIVAVMRSGLTEKAKTRLALFDNRTAETAEWNIDVLADLNTDAMLEGMFRTDEIDALLAILEPERTEGAGGDEFDTTPDEGPTRVQPGDVWQLGEHRLMCGDSTKAEDVARLLADAKPPLMVTDPPYGVNYDPQWRNDAAEKGLIAYAARSVGVVSNDHQVDWSEAYRLFDGNVAYVWHAGRHATEVAAGLETSGFEIVCQIIWAKPNFAISRGDYHWQHEPCWYAVRKGSNHNWQGSRSEATLWEITREAHKEHSEHSTQKPVECMARPIRNNSAKGQSVYDPFLGSGTTLIAAERTGRKCYGMEIEPKYCDVILRRYEAETGKQAVRLTEVTVDA